MSGELASVDGQILLAAEATIPATDDGLLRGDGAFEVLRLYGGRPFAGEEHLLRLAASAKNIQLDFDDASLRAEIDALLAEHGERDGCLRIVLTRGGIRLLLTEPLPERGASVTLGAVTYQPSIVLDGVKSLSYAANMMAGRLAVDRGFDEALLVTPEGAVLEAPTATLFWVEGTKVFTPPLADRILESITRRHIVDLTAASEMSVDLAELLERADEAFLASTTREIQPVSAIESLKLPENGPVTAELAGQLHDRVTAELASN